MPLTLYPHHEATKLMPDMSAEEFADLKADIEANGQKVPCKIWHGQLLDGRHRKRACIELGLQPTYEDVSNEPDPLKYVVSLNYVQRSLTDSQKDAIAAELVMWDSFIPLAKVMQQIAARERQDKVRELAKEGIQGKEIAKELNVSQATISNDLKAPLTPVPPVIGKTTEQASEIMGRSKASVKKAVAVQNEAPELLEGMKAGLITTSDAYRNKDLSKEVREDALEKVQSGKSKTLTDAVRETQREHNREESFRSAAMAPISRRVKLYTASVQDAINEIEPDSVDIIITDPPYPRQYLDTWRDLGAFAAHALKSGGMLAAMSGQSYLPEVFRNLEHENLAYRWMICYYFEMGIADVRFRQFGNHWKPVLIYHKGVLQKDMDKLPHRLDYIEDGNTKSMFSGAVLEQNQTHHIWGQRLDGFKALIRQFSGPGDVICDPFIGSGTTALATLEIGEGRTFVGGEIDSENVEISRGRIADWMRMGLE